MIIKTSERTIEIPCDFNDTLYWTGLGYAKEVWFKGIRCDKGYKPQIICRYVDNNLNSKETPIASLDSFGKTVFLTREGANKSLNSKF